MSKKPLIRWLALLLLIMAVAGAMFVSAAEPAPVTDGIVLEKMPIVIPAGATDVEKSAAKELQHYLKELTGRSSTIITETANAGSCIYLGATKFAAAHNMVEKNDQNPDGAYTNENGVDEGWAIKVIDGSLVITGGVTRGTLYGVYHLLEDQFGIHWWNWWEEYVPELDSAVLPLDFEDSGEPAFANRNVASYEGLPTLYHVRNRLASDFLNIPQAYGGAQTYTMPYRCHTFNRFYPAFYFDPGGAGPWQRFYDAINPDRVDWFVEHQDWFAYSKARGERISYGQMCLTNEGLLEDFIEKALITIKVGYEEADREGKARPFFINLSPNDLGGFCECDACEADIAARGPSGYVLNFTNKIAEAIEKVYPEIMVDALIYWQTLEVPLDDTVPRDNVIVHLANSDTNNMRDLDHWTNEKIRDRIEAWADLVKPGQLIYWGYGINYSENGVHPNVFVFGPDLQKLADADFYGALYEMQNVNTTDFWDLKQWVAAKLLEDPYQDDHEVVKTFTYGYYGEDAGDDLYEYLVYMDEQADDCTEGHFSYKIVEDTSWLTAAEVKKGTEYFDKAIAETKANTNLTDAERELYLNRIAAARIGLDVQILACYDRYAQEMYASAGGDPEKLFGLTSQEVGQRMIEAYQWLISMELEDDYTGIQNPGKRSTKGGDLLSRYQRYASGTDPITGELLDRPAIPEQIFEDHPGIDPSHIFDYTEPAMWKGSYHYGNKFITTVGGASYEGGTSVLMDQGIRVNMRGEPGYYYIFDENSPFLASFAPKWYLGDPLLNDGQWHLYRAEDVVVVNDSYDRVSICDESINVYLTDKPYLYMDKVDVYVSMKIAGDPSGEDPNNYVKIWVDRIIIVEDCTAHDINYTDSIPATCAHGEIQLGLCPVCGKEARKEIEGTKLRHKFIGDNVYDAETNTYTNYCSDCGEIVYDDFYAELPAEVIAAMEEKNATLDSVYDFAASRDLANGGISEIIKDTDSPLGFASRYDVNITKNLDHFIIDNNRGIYTWSGQIPPAEVPMADDIITDGQYHIYRMRDVNLFPSDDVKNLYLFDWSFDLPLTDLQHLKGKTVDMFLSFKVVGELDYSTPGKMPKYYVDRIILLENCGNHVAETYEYDKDRKLYVGNCMNCGVEITSSLPVDLLYDITAGKTNAIHINDYDATIFTPVDASIENDADAHNGKAFYVSGRFHGNDITFGFWNVAEWLRFSGAELKANDGKGYHYYKADDVVVPTEADGDLGYLWAFDWSLQTHALWGYFNGLMGKTLDIYVSIKIEGADVYIDRFIVVDNCGNHIDSTNTEKLTDATCYQGEIHLGTCTVCGRTSESELMETRLPHKFGTYTYDPATGNQTAECQNDGCDKVDVKSSKGALPQSIQDDMAAGITAYAHIKDVSASEITFGLYDGWMVKTDTDAAGGKALYHNSKSMNADFVLSSVNGGEFIRIKSADMKANVNKGYQFYKIDNYKVPVMANGDLGYIWGFDWNLQIKSPMWAVLNGEMGKTVDVYLSMKLVGDTSNAAISIDRFIVVDFCDDYEIDYKAPEDTTCADKIVTMVGNCPICGMEKTKEIVNSDTNHSFTKYVSYKFDERFEAQCDYGCGAIDEKIVPLPNAMELLPEELDVHPDHVIVAYRAPDIQMSTVDDYMQIDPDTGRIVAVRTYNPELTASTQYAFNTATGLYAGVWSQNGPSSEVGTFSGTEIMANADDGKYHLYTVEGSIPITHKNYRYFYSFADWCMKLEMFDDDLIAKGYVGKSIDLHYYMKVDGDPSCAGPEKPVYYVDQIIVTESCQVDDTWVETKKATCTEKGEMVGYCQVCKEYTTLPTPKLDHSISNYHVRQAATCKTDMQIYGKCDVCGEVPWDGIFVPNTKLTHEFSKYVRSSDGLTEFAYCDLGCGERITRPVERDNNTLDETVDGIIDITDGITNVVEDILGIEDDQRPVDTLTIMGGAGGGRAFRFSDIKESDWYYQNVKEAWENKLIDGVTATEFRPNDTLTVAQAVKLAAAYHERYNTGDVSLTNGADNWYSTYVDYAIENGIIDSKYANYDAAKMNMTIDRSEFVAIFAKAMDAEELVGYNTVSDNAIPDVKMDDEAADAIYTFYRAGILTGSDGKGTFNPHSSIKRCEVAAILSRMFDSNVRQSITLG